MRAGIADSFESPTSCSEEAGGEQYHERVDQQGYHSEFDFPCPDFLAQILRCPSDHHAGHKDSDDYVKQHVDHAHAFTSVDTVQPHTHHGCQCGKRVETVCFRIYCAAGHVCCDCSVSGACRGAEAHFFTFEIAEMLVYRQA